MTEKPETFDCRQCGEETPEHMFKEGVCETCCEANQRALDQHNAEFDAWQRLTDAERWERIRRAGP